MLFVAVQEAVVGPKGRIVFSSLVVAFGAKMG